MSLSSVVASASVLALLAVGCASSPPPASSSPGPSQPADAEPSASTAGEPAAGAAGDDGAEANDEGAPESSTAEKCTFCEDDACYASCESLCDKAEKDACDPVVGHLEAAAHELAGKTEGKSGAALEAIEKQIADMRAKTLRHAKRGCELGAPSSCQVHGSLAWSGQAGDSGSGKYAISFAAFKRGCDLGEMMSCSSLAAHHLAGEGTAKDPGKAAEAWERSCMESRYGCSDLKKLIVQKNPRALAAQSTIAKACAALDPKAIRRTACDAKKELESK